MTNITQNDFSGAVLLLTDDTRAEEIAATVAAGYFPETEYHYSITESTPTHLPVHIQDQIGANQRDLGVPSNVLTVYPWAQSEVKSL